jgi:phospholipase/carboxylesterase
MTAQFVTYENETVSPKALFLYHGTGGNETDLLPLVQPFFDTYRIVGIRGNIQEQGMNRYFVRYPDGTFDRESIRGESRKLQQFLSEWSQKTGVAKENITHVGYSNGANFILANLFLYPESMVKAVLLHPMLPLEPPATLDLSDKKLFVSWASNDPMISEEQTLTLISKLKKRHANLDEFQGTNGHRISQEEVNSLQNFLSF